MRFCVLSFSVDQPSKHGLPIARVQSKEIDHVVWPARTKERLTRTSNATLGIFLRCASLSFLQVPNQPGDILSTSFRAVSRSVRHSIKVIDQS